MATNINPVQGTSGALAAVTSTTTINTNNVAQDRQKLAKMLQLHGYCPNREALVLLEDHYTCSTNYESMEDFITKLNRVITFHTDADSSHIDSDLAHLAIEKLFNLGKAGAEGDQQDDVDEGGDKELPKNLTVKVKNVYQQQARRKPMVNCSGGDISDNVKIEYESEFKIHYNFLFKKLNMLPVFRGDFKLTNLATLTGSSQPSIRCICYGLLLKDLSKIDGYMLIDSTGRVPVRLSPDTTFRNRLAYTNCMVLVEGVYLNPDDVLFAANIGLPPCLLDPLTDKSLSCADDKMVIVLKELYLDEEDVLNALDILFTGYNCMEEPPILFILIGDFTRQPCEIGIFRKNMKKLIGIIRACDNLKDCHFVFVPGQRDTTPNVVQSEELPTNSRDTNAQTMPKSPLTKEQLPVNLFQLSHFNNIHLATNPTHIFLGDRQISVVAHSYFKKLRKNLLHDLSDHREELFETCKQIILSNAHLAAGITKSYPNSMNLWHRPDLLILADTEAFGNRYDYSSSSQTDTSFITIPSFSRQYSQFKVYYLKSGEIEDSQVSSEALDDVEDVEPVSGTTDESAPTLLSEL